jgi:iron complex transport system ATP-binding protein
MSAIVVRDVSLRIGSSTLIRDVSLEVDAGTWCTVVGPNGAGKTTLVETVAGLRRPSTGEVEMGGEPLHSMNERARALRVALVTQHPIIPVGMSVLDYVALSRTPYHGLLRAPNATDRQAVAEVMERLSLEEYADRDVITLSGGERQRAVLARALAQTTKVLVLDEPITGLDLRHQMTILELLQNEVRHHGLTVLATLHDLTLAGQFADRLVLLDKGRVVLDGPSGVVVRSKELSECYQMELRVIDVDGADVVVPARH